MSDYRFIDVYEKHIHVLNEIFLQINVQKKTCNFQLNNLDKVKCVR